MLTVYSSLLRFFFFISKDHYSFIQVFKNSINIHQVIFSQKHKYVTNFIGHIGRVLPVCVFKPPLIECFYYFFPPSRVSISHQYIDHLKGKKWIPLLEGKLSPFHQLTHFPPYILGALYYFYRLFLLSRRLSFKWSWAISCPQDPF